MLRDRPFQIPDPVIQGIAETPDCMTAVLHAHAGHLGDYDQVKAWYRHLSREFNWVGATLMFNVIHAYHQRESAGDSRYRQTITERDNQPVAYSRFLHLSRDTQTRRMDCTKVEETIISDPADLRDLTLFRHMYDSITASAALAGRARVITELGTGLSPRKFRTMAGVCRKYADTPDSPEFQRASALFHRDWLGVTTRFIDRMGFTVTDVIIPEPHVQDATPQLRISRLTGAARPLTLPPYTATDRLCLPYNNGRGLQALSSYLNDIKRYCL